MSKKIIFLWIWLLSVLFLFATAAAEPWSFTLRNDYLVPGGLDRYLSNAFELRKGAYAIGNDLYTPTSKKNPEIPVGDRPWDGYTYLEIQDIAPESLGEELVQRYRVGFVGDDSGARALQQFVHDDLGLGQHPTWAGQNPSEPTFEYILSKRSREYMQSVVGDSQLRQEYGARVGNVKDSLFLDQELRKHFWKWAYPYVGLRGEVVLYNTHLDGRLFQENVYTIDKEWFVATARAGIEFYFPRSEWFVDFHYEYQTQEFEGQVDRHAYTNLSIGQKF